MDVECVLRSKCIHSLCDQINSEKYLNISWFRYLLASACSPCIYQHIYTYICCSFCFLLTCFIAISFSFRLWSLSLSVFRSMHVISSFYFILLWFVDRRCAAFPLWSPIDAHSLHVDRWYAVWWYVHLCVWVHLFHIFARSLQRKYSWN